MATLVRWLFKTILFIGLFLLSVRYVHTYPLPMPENQLSAWLSTANRIGIRDPDDLYIPVMLVIEFIVALLAYTAIIKLWRRYNAAK
ncbi:hypothetical protein LMG28688_03729 [Paraburkholderia caffeinitolerans]|uniref:Uncharacterized protein n=1 Tax=Paraburkholderia caffeinitolerans TaxID=1723730 RepID=A0A6J5G4T5_9BURK|nr:MULTISPECIES: hypothetical protein [Paraburkholderia]CAB3793525.1 hypothetical protein LMG28688_03729 [Paraburkholderia caffeinitolerans]